MERLTFVDEDGMVLFDNPADFPEDVGFTIRELAENEEWGTLDEIAERLANAEQRLQNYKDLEEQGFLLKLPVKKVYYIVDRKTKYATVVSRDISSLCLYEIEGIDKKGYYWSTQEKAEEALRKMNETDG